MPALNYTKFTDRVADGRKRQTIRAWRKRPIRVGDVLFHYSGMRTKFCRKLRPDTICKSADPITIDYDRVNIKGVDLSGFEIIDLARNDGFPDVTDFFNYFHKTHGFPFLGQVITW